MQPNVHIVILNWNGYSDTEECLMSLKNITYPNYNVVLVDNGSNNDEAKLLKDKFGNYIHVIENKNNLGFAEGNNVGIRYSLKQGADFILLLNNDTEVEPDFLIELISKSNNSLHIGIVGAKIVYYSDRNKIYCLGGGHANIYVDNFNLIGAKSPISEEISESEVIKKMGYVSGCCMLIKSELLEKIGLFDTNYFTYFEETDLCIRAKNDGWNFSYSHRAIIYHKSAQSSKYLSGKYVYYMLRNRLYIIRKFTRKPFFYYYYFTIFLFKNVIGYLFLLMNKSKLSYSKYIFKAIKDFNTNKFSKLDE